MVISFLFLAVILALGVNLLNSERTKNRKSTAIGDGGGGGGGGGGGRPGNQSTIYDLWELRSTIWIF